MLDGPSHRDRGRPAAAPVTARCRQSSTTLGTAWPWAGSSAWSTATNAEHSASEIAGCRFPGCDQTRWVDAHHIVHWTKGGGTESRQPDPRLSGAPPLAPRGRLDDQGTATSGLTFHDPSGQYGRCTRCARTTGASTAATRTGDSDLCIGGRTAVPLRSRRVGRIPSDRVSDGVAYRPSRSGRGRLGRHQPRLARAAGCDRRIPRARRARRVGPGSGLSVRALRRRPSARVLVEGGLAASSPRDPRRASCTAGHVRGAVRWVRDHLVPRWSGQRRLPPRPRHEVARRHADRDPHARPATAVPPPAASATSTPTTWTTRVRHTTSHLRAATCS